MNLIKFKDVWEMYKIKFVTDGKVSWDNFWALKDITFNVEKGETLGIIGENGAGKSTILKLITGMLRPDRGEIEVSGRVSGLLELGAGFQPELTGRENVYLNAGLFGLTQNQVDAKYEEIVSFANIGKFINAPVKCYSQGMFVRLAFAIAIHIDPDILLIDDTLAVGDEYFQRKCIKKIFELKEQGKTIIFVTHDMNMLSRLCKRAIFLKEGRIVKDGLLSNVLPLYTQMIGVREGVGSLEKKPLNLVFNNGRFFLNWQNKLLTPNSGIYTVFRIGDRWYSSLQADWEVKRENESELVATGKFYQLDLTQTWRLEIIDDYAIKWDIEMEPQESLEIQEGYTNIMLTNKYTQWFTPLERGKFPPIDDKDKNWQALLDENIFRKCIGVEAKETIDDKIPSLVFEQANYASASRGQILNSDYLANCRVLQYKTFSLQNYSVSLANRFIYFSGKISLDIPDINNYLEKVQDEFILSRGKMKLSFNKGQCILSYNGMNLTKASHINTSIYINGRRYSSNLAQWEIKKEEKNKLVARGIWRNLPIVQVWKIEVTGESSFVWEVNLQVNEDVDIEEQNVQFMCYESYKYWFSEYGKGSFPESFLEAETDVMQRCIPDGIVGLQGQNNQLPAISLKFSKDLNNFAKIINSDFYEKARILRMYKVESEEDARFLPGRYQSFRIEAILEKDRQVCVEDSTNILQREKLRFIFDKGRGRIYWQERELTKRVGLYTSLRSQGRWYDSYSKAMWNIEEKTEDTIKVFGKWLHLPISQRWQIRLKENKIIELNVKMKVDKGMDVDRLQTNIMISEGYKEWVTNEERGFFPPFKNDIDDDWQVLWSNFSKKGENKDYIGVFKNYRDRISLPTVILFPEKINSGWFLNIINSDPYHRGRVLQYLKKDKDFLSPGEYYYYKGIIVIEE